MQIPQLRMTSQMGQIQMAQSSGQLQIAQPKADMSISQPKAQMSIRTSEGKLTIDQSQAFEGANLYSALRATAKEAQAGRQAAQEGVRRRAAEGAQLIDIHLGGNQIVEQAKQKGHRQYVSPSIKYIPSPFSVKTNYEKGKVIIDARANEPQIDVRINKPRIDFQRGGVNISMAQHPHLSIHFESVVG